MKHQCTQCQTIVDDMINVCPQCGNEDDFIELPNDDMEREATHETD